jgi:predicted RNase H-like HicB family nuclease
MKRQKLLSYTVFFEPASEGGYTVTIPALPGCVTEGDTLQEAREMATDAIKCYCESLLKDGEPLPVDVELPEPVKEKLQVALGE